jgi:undecaprenyl phosphate-alpha-L-ara4N flippase subunit ArnE
MTSQRVLSSKDWIGRAAPPLSAGKPPPGWYLHSSLHIALNCILTTASELLLKVGARQSSHTAAPGWLAWTGIITLGSGWVIAGIAVNTLSFFNWLYVLRRVPLSIAYPVTSVAIVLIALGAWIFLGEQIGPLRWMGIGLITAGILVCARPAAIAEARL